MRWSLIDLRLVFEFVSNLQFFYLRSGPRVFWGNFDDRLFKCVFDLQHLAASKTFFSTAVLKFLCFGQQPFLSHFLFPAQSHGLRFGGASHLMEFNSITKNCKPNATGSKSDHIQQIGINNYDTYVTYVIQQRLNLVTCNDKYYKIHRKLFFNVPPFCFKNTIFVFHRHRYKK